MEKDPFDCAASVIWKMDIQRIFNKVIKGRYDCLDHFAVNLILPDKRTLNLCSNAEYITSYRRMNMHNYSSGLFPELVANLPVVPWRLLVHRNDHYRLNKYVSFKEVLHGLYSGMSFIHKIDDFYLNVAVASYSKDLAHALTFLNNAEDILAVGVYFLEEFKKRLEVENHIIIPSIEDIALTNKEFNKIDQMAADWQNLGVFIARSKFI